MKIQPIDVDSREDSPPVTVKPVVVKSRFKRLFPGVLRNSAAEKPPAGEQPPLPAIKDGEFDPSSVCLATMVQSYMEETTDKPLRGGRHRCNCFNPNGNDSSDDELDSDSPSGDFADLLKSLVPCASAVGRNLLADTSAMIEKSKTLKQPQKSDLRKIVAVGLSSLGYDSSICKSTWDKSPSIPAGEYEYIDVVVDGERFLIDIDFRSEFEIARSTSAYKAVLHSLPCVFVGKPDRLGSIVSVVSDAARASFKKKGMHLAPWRKVEYMKAKWLAPYTRLNDTGFEDKTTERENEVQVMTWHPPAVKPKDSNGPVQRVTGLASLLRERA